MCVYAFMYAQGSDPARPHPPARPGTHLALWSSGAPFCHSGICVHCPQCFSGKHFHTAKPTCFALFLNIEHQHPG